MVTSLHADPAPRPAVPHTVFPDLATHLPAGSTHPAVNRKRLTSERWPDAVRLVGEHVPRLAMGRCCETTGVDPPELAISDQ